MVVQPRDWSQSPRRRGRGVHSCTVELHAVQIPAPLSFEPHGMYLRVNTSPKMDRALFRKRSSSSIGDHEMLSGEFVVGTANGVHDIVRGTAINGVLLIGQHGGRQLNEAAIITSVGIQLRHWFQRHCQKHCLTLFKHLFRLFH